MKVALASDHRGFEFKKVVVKELEEKEIEVSDFGTYNDESCDYPDYAKLAVEEVVKNRADFAILICGSGIGMSIVANKFRGIRGALCLNSEMAKMAREHNNANVLILSAIFTPRSEIKDILTAWFSSNFLGGRHERRLLKIKEIEQS